MSYGKRSKPSTSASYRGARKRPASPARSHHRTRFGSSLKSTVCAGLRTMVELIVAAPALFWYGLAGAAVVFWAVVAFKSALDLPTVYRSYATHKCVSVKAADGTAGSCRHLPKRYNNAWVY